MDRVTKIHISDSIESSTSVSTQHPSTATSTSDSDTTSSWSDGTTELTPKCPANTSAARAVAVRMTPPPDREQLQAPANCTTERIISHIPITLSGITLAAGFVTTIVAGVGINSGDHTASPPFFYEGLFIGGGLGIAIGVIAGMMTLPAPTDHRPQQTNPV